MEFAAANIWQDFHTASQTEYGALDDNANEVILGPRLNDAVRHLANGYLKTLDLGPETKATDERAKLLDLHWGHVEQDGAQLRGLGAAMTNFAEVLGANVTTLAGSWQGESYDAFKAAIDKVQRTLSEYGTAATTTGDGLVNAMSQIRELYQTFADDSANKHLNFGEVSPPEKWHKVVDWSEDDNGYAGNKLAEACPTDHGSVVDYNWNCLKNDDAQRNIITGRFVTEHRWDICKGDPCEENAGRVIIMYNNMVDECQAAIDRIKGKLHNYFGAVNTTVDGVTKLYDAALGNVFNLAGDEVFSSLRIIGGQPAGGPTDSSAPADSGYPGSGGGGAPVDSGYPSGGDAGPASATEPMPAEPEPTESEPAETEPAEDTAPADAAVQGSTDQAASVQVTAGDHTIGVTSPDGEGRVMVTVQDAAGQTKSYALDFGAASGLQSGSQPVEPGPDGVVPEEVPARTDGKCVIQDGALTITAERPLFSPDSIKLVVDDGSGNPSTYTLDFEQQDTTDQNPTDTASTGAAPGGSASTGTDPGASASTGTAPGGAVPGGSALAGIDSSGSVVAGAAADGSASVGSAQDGSTALDASTSAGAAASSGSVADSSEAGATAPTPAAQPPVSAAHLTSPQSWHGDGSVSGELRLPDQPGGEAQLAKAPDDAEPSVAGMAGAGMPMMGGGPSGGGAEGGRAGSGWSVHGDLFDSAEPVYSMHGVLGDDDRTE